MITVEKLEKGTYFDDAFKISFRYDPTTVAKVKELAERRYLPEDRAWEIPAHELPALIEKVGLEVEMEGDEKTYDYIAIPYPEGYIDSETMFLFMQEDIENVSFVGFVDAQLQVFRTALEETDENDE